MPFVGSLPMRSSSLLRHCVLPCCAAGCLLSFAVYAHLQSIGSHGWLIHGAAGLHPDCSHFTGLACIPNNTVTAAHLVTVTLHCTLPVCPLSVL